MWVDLKYKWPSWSTYMHTYVHKCTCTHALHTSPFYAHGIWSLDLYPTQTHWLRAAESGPVPKGSHLIHLLYVGFLTMHRVSVRAHLKDVGLHSGFSHETVEKHRQLPCFQTHPFHEFAEWLKCLTLLKFLPTNYWKIDYTDPLYFTLLPLTHILSHYLVSTLHDLPESSSMCICSLTHDTCY